MSGGLELEAVYQNHDLVTMLHEIEVRKSDLPLRNPSYAHSTRCVFWCRGLDTLMARVPTYSFRVLVPWFGYILFAR